VTVDSKTVLKGRNTPAERTGCTTFKKPRDSLVPEVKSVPVVGITGAVFLSPVFLFLFLLIFFFLLSPHPLKMVRSKVTGSAVLVVLEVLRDAISGAHAL